MLELERSSGVYRDAVGSCMLCEIGPQKMSTRQGPCVKVAVATFRKRDLRRVLSRVQRAYHITTLPWIAGNHLVRHPVRNFETIR